MLRSHNVQVITQYVQCTTFTFVSDVNLHNGKVLYDKMYPNSSKEHKMCVNDVFNIKHSHGYNMLNIILTLCVVFRCNYNTVSKNMEHIIMCVSLLLSVC